VGGDRLSQIGSAVAAEVAAVANLGPELLGRVSSAARRAERYWMIRARLEEHRPESDEQHHDGGIVIIKPEPVKDRLRKVRWKGVDSGA
jgi:hypothetical protein